jgi:Protein of unknown function (DUF229)
VADNDLFRGHEGTGEILATLDRDLRDFLRFILIEQGGASNTVVILQSDHGNHMSLPYLLTRQGRIEHMNPAAWLLLPSFKAMPSLSLEARQRLKENAMGLTTHADLFMTLRDVMTLATTTTTSATSSDEVSTRSSSSSLPTPLQVPSKGATIWQPLRPPRSGCEGLDVPDHRFRSDRQHTQFVPFNDAPEGSPEAPEEWRKLVMKGVSLFNSLNDNDDNAEKAGGKRTCEDATIPSELCYCY